MSRKTNYLVSCFKSMQKPQNLFDRFVLPKFPEPDWGKVMGNLKINNLRVKNSKLTPFKIGDETIYAINQKNAIRKYEKQKQLLGI